VETVFQIAQSKVERRLRRIIKRRDFPFYTWPLKANVYTQLKKRDAVAGVCSCNHLNTYRNSWGESKLELSWSQEQIVRLRSPRRSCNGQGLLSPRIFYQVWETQSWI